MSNDWTKRKPGESLNDYLKRVSKRIKSKKSTDWSRVEKAATAIVKDIRRPQTDLEKELERRRRIKKIFGKKKRKKKPSG